MYAFSYEITRHLKEFLVVHPVFMYSDAPVIPADKASYVLNLLFIS